MIARVFTWFEGLLHPYPGAPPSRPPEGLVAFCLHYVQGAKALLAVMGALAALIAIIEVSLFGFLGTVVDWLANADRETFFQTEGTWLALMALAILVVLPAADLLLSLLSHQSLLGNMPQRIRWMAHRYLIRQSMTYFQDEFAGRIAAKLMQTALAVREVAMKLLDILVYVTVYFIGAVVLAASSDLLLAVPFLIWLAIYVLLLRYFIPRLGRISEKQADARSLMTGRIVDSYTNISTVKLFSHSSGEERYARDAMDQFLVTVHRQMRLSTLRNSSITMLNMVLLVSLGWLGIWLWQQAQITPGGVAIAVALVLRFQGMSHWIMWEMSALFENIGTVRDGINSISLPRLVSDRPGAEPLGRVDGHIRFENVGFAYGQTRGVISDLDLDIPAGQKVGLVGRSGAGKSTLVNLLLRFYDVEQGRILIDGRDIAAVTQESLRAQIAMVTQDTSLLHRSVRENILYGRPTAPEALMLAAAKQAEAHDFILQLADARGRNGYDAHVGERGVKLSGGQRQRVAIARVILKDAPILVLDEATSALDSEVEAAIHSQLDRLMKGKTVIAIAHRLSTIAAMDRLVVMDQGRIVEDGTHRELLEQNGHYAKLWHRQSGGFISAGETEEIA
ncbi:MAG TPA: ABC transporter ATP-binding protein [Devosiaceae bacterium]|nr:ABC transporter ATP-binding protein [Devosiaceae bacterium]